METKIKALLALPVLICGFIFGCGQRSRNSSAQNSQMDMNERQTMTTIEGKITEDQASWTSRLQKLTIGTDDLTGIQLVKPNKAFLATQRGILNVSIEGTKTTHETVPLPQNVSDEIASIFFVDSSLGWTLLRRTPADVLDHQGFESFVLNTLNGGRDWHAQYQGKAQELERIMFLDDYEGWIVGSAPDNSQTFAHRPLVLHTTDRGEHWTDVSFGLNRLGKGRIADVYADHSQVLMVTSERSVVGSNDAGQNWQRLGQIEGEPTQVGMYRIGSAPDGRPWVLGGTGGREGTWSILAIKTDRSTWTKNKIYDVLLKDATFLSKEEVIACGVLQSDNKVSLLDDDHRAGAILRSSDGGRNWTIIYRDPKAKSINAIAVEAGRYVWAVGDNGTIVRLTTTTKSA